MLILVQFACNQVVDVFHAAPYNYSPLFDHDLVIEHPSIFSYIENSFPEAVWKDQLVQ